MNPSDIAFDWITLDEAMAAGVEDLLALHWQEVAMDQETFPLSPNWAGYRTLERSGVLRGIAAWKGGALVGYNVFFVQPTLHYSTSAWAVNDILYLAPAERRGLTGARLIRKSEEMLHGLGVRKVIYHTKLHVHLGHAKTNATVGRLLSALGYAHIEDVMAKVI